MDCLRGSCWGLAAAIDGALWVVTETLDRFVYEGARLVDKVAVKDNARVEIDWRRRSKMAMTLCIFLSAAYGLAVMQLYEFEPPAIFWPVHMAFAVSGLFLVYVIFFLHDSAVLPYCSKCLIGVAGIVFLFTMLAQFPINMMLVARQYPYVCEFSAVASGEAISYKGVRPAGASPHLKALSYEPLHSTDDYDWDVECDPPHKILGFRGGRMPIQLMSQFIPLVFFLMYASGIGYKLRLSFQSMVVDSMDLQDFFLMLLDDELILGYWNKGDMYGGGPGGKVEWTMIYTWSIVAAAYLSIYPLIKVLATPRKRIVADGDGSSSESELSTPMGSIAGSVSHGYIHEECCDMGGCYSRVLRFEILCSLFLIDVPFGILRLRCATAFKQPLPAMLVKNALSGMYDVLRLCAVDLSEDSFTMIEFLTGKGRDGDEENVLPKDVRDVSSAG